MAKKREKIAFVTDFSIAIWFGYCYDKNALSRAAEGQAL